MIKIADKSKCTGCSACANACPKNSIKMLPDELGFLYPNVDLNSCINCGLCEKTCPVLSNNNLDRKIQKAYAVRCKDLNIRMNSSSGGVFSLLGLKILDEEGVVYGAALNESLQVNHFAAKSLQELIPLRGSKIIQSSIGYVFQDVKNELLSGKKVLFTGTPCQIFGLHNYLGKQYNNLITQDIICHGVCSPVLFEKYISYKKDKHGSGIRSIRFRDKNTGWRNYSVSICYDNGDSTVVPHGKDELMRAYLKNYALRPACYSCCYKGMNRASDITLADFWGAEHFVSKFDDDKGISFVICRSDIGNSYIKSILNETDSEEVNYSDVVKYNMSAEVSSKQPTDNDLFCKSISSMPFNNLIETFCKVSLTTKLKRTIKSVLKLR